MNLNEFPEELKQEEQRVLDNLISRMDKVISNLDVKMKGYVKEAKDANISVNPDEYLSQVMAQEGIRDTVENRKKYLRARDELYHTRLLLKYDGDQGSGIEEVKVGLHSCLNGKEQFVIKWDIPLCRHYILDNASTEYESIVVDKHKKEYHTKYKLLVKNAVELRFTHVVKATNLFPGLFDDKTLEMLKNKDYLSDAFLDKMIKRFNPDEFNPESAAKIISDEFLQELLERRSTPEFKNIVFSIQKQQGEIIQAPYKKNMIVQGCAGSGKSMIMLHRLPILLYDNPTSLDRTNLYIITPSQMYIQLAQNMRSQLEISDINMGTIEQYYDACINRYPSHNSKEYGKISWGSKIKHENEQYIYSVDCIKDIKNYYEKLIMDIGDPLDKAYAVLNISDHGIVKDDTYLQMLRGRLSKLQNVINANEKVLSKYFKNIQAVLKALSQLSAGLKNRKEAKLRDIAKQISEAESVIAQAEKEIEKLDPEANALALENRKSIIASAQVRITNLNEEKESVEADTEYFNSLNELNKKVINITDMFSAMEKVEYSNVSTEDIYTAIGKIGQLIGGYFMLSWELSTIEDKYAETLGAISILVDKAGRCVTTLQGTTDKYIDFKYYDIILYERDVMAEYCSKAVMDAYEMIMHKIGINKAENGKMKAIKCSPYIYLRAIYEFQGIPTVKGESLLAIDEAQGIAPTEIKLLREINKDAVFNLYGDIHQHIEGTKGIDSWEEFKDSLDYDLYEMQENYRNASQVTEYCNRIFGMKMRPINTPGKGVHELKTQDEFNHEMLNQLIDNQRAGLSAILVGNDAEARVLMDQFSAYEEKFHDLTGEDFNVHRTKWNIINIDDAKGLEFSTVIAVSGRMSRNEKYIAYTRALDELYVYNGVLSVDGFEKKPRIKRESAKTESNHSSSGKIVSFESKKLEKEAKANTESKHAASNKKVDHSDSEVRTFFESKGLEVVDKRNEGGRLWVVGDKQAIKECINEAIAKFKISGKYATSKEIKNREGWCTKTDK